MNILYFNQLKKCEDTLIINMRRGGFDEKENRRGGFYEEEIRKGGLYEEEKRRGGFFEEEKRKGGLNMWRGDGGKFPPGRS